MVVLKRGKPQNKPIDGGAKEERISSGANEKKTKNKPIDGDAKEKQIIGGAIEKKTKKNSIDGGVKEKQISGDAKEKKIVGDVSISEYFKLNVLLQRPN